MNKLQYQVGGAGGKHDGAWNQRPRDAANFVRWAGHQSERFLNWQVVNLASPDEDLREAPILYIAGDHQGVTLSADDEARLKRFVEEGGLIVGNADCANPIFAQSFRKLGTRLFPYYEFRQLPKDHLIFHNQFDRANWTTQTFPRRPQQRSQELMILFAQDDPPRYWQTGACQTRPAMHELMFNIYSYVVDKQIPPHRGQWYAVTANADKADRTIKVARLNYAGNWDPEPGGWRSAWPAFMHNVQKTDLSVDSVELGQGKLAGYSVAHLTGTDSFALDAAQQDELKKFVAGGGTLIVDSCGGSVPFAAAARTQLAAIWGSCSRRGPSSTSRSPPPTRPCPPALPSATASATRSYAIKRLGNTHEPRLSCSPIEFNGRCARLHSSPERFKRRPGPAKTSMASSAACPNPKNFQDDKDKTITTAAGISQIMASLLMYAGQMSGFTIARVWPYRRQLLAYNWGLAAAVQSDPQTHHKIANFQ